MDAPAVTVPMSAPDRERRGADEEVPTLSRLGALVAAIWAVTVIGAYVTARLLARGHGTP